MFWAVFRGNGSSRLRSSFHSRRSGSPHIRRGGIFPAVACRHYNRRQKQHVNNPCSHSCYPFLKTPQTAQVLPAQLITAYVYYITFWLSIYRAQRSFCFRRGAEHHVKHDYRNHAGNSSHAAERFAHDKYQTELVDEEGHRVSKHVLEDDGEPQPFAAAQLFVHRGNRCQARAVKQVEYQEAERCHRVLEHAHRCLPQACVVLSQFADANQYADSGNDCFLGNKAGDGSRNSLPFAEAQRCKIQAIAPPIAAIKLSSGSTMP